MSDVERRRAGLSESTTETQFDNGYWYAREEQLSAGRRITYGHLVKQAIVLNNTKQGPLRVEHGRYINFISDFMAQSPRRSQSDAVRAWEELKRMDAPKTYEVWAARATRRDKN